MARKSITPPQHEVSAGEILVGLAWGVLYTAVIAWGWASAGLMLLAEYRSPSLF
jgi:hypothetical protein